MFLDRWRARRAILSRSPPSSVEEEAHPRLREVVESLLDTLGTPNSLGDPSWHFRWDGDLQLVGLDATQRSVTDVRQRLLRLVHELDLRHLSRSARRVLAVVLCAPQGDEDLKAWHARLQVDRGEVGERDWRAACRRIELLAITPDGQHAYFGTNVDLRRAVESQLLEPRG